MRRLCMCVFMAFKKHGQQTAAQTYTQICSVNPQDAALSSHLRRHENANALMDRVYTAVLHKCEKIFTKVA